MLTGSAEAQIAPKPLNAQVQAILSQISADNIAEIQKHLESFGTRNIYSATDDPSHGVGAAREWIAKQFKSYSPKLQVSFDKHRLAEQGRAFKNVEIWNVVAVLPGTSEPDRQVLVTGHYDTINMVYRTNEKGVRELDPEKTAAATAPGVTDDGSGTAAVMELARVMSQYQFRKTVVFITFAAEEYGLFGSGLYAQDAKEKQQIIEGVFNNDIIGSDVSGNGAMTNQRVNVYSEEPNDSGSRQLARYMKEASERYTPGFEVSLVFRHDRFGRGGDHSPFNALGYSAIRITTPSENFSINTPIPTRLPTPRLPIQLKWRRRTQRVRQPWRLPRKPRCFLPLLPPRAGLSFLLSAAARATTPQCTGILTRPSQIWLGMPSSFAKQHRLTGKKRFSWGTSASSPCQT